MRYECWDVILFPRHSHVPIQEFKTTYYNAYDKYGRLLPTLTCYVASLPPNTPFRVSIHSWAAKGKATALMDAQRKANEKVVITIQIVVDGVRLFHDFYEFSTKWPQDIEYEKRSVEDGDHQSSHRRPPLEFPPFRQILLMQDYWDARDANGRINVFLTEQLVDKSCNSPGDYEFGETNDIICFSFQHAPRDFLEQAGIAWPISNPLYLSALSENPTSTTLDPNSFAPTTQRVGRGIVTLPPPRQTSTSKTRAREIDENARSKTVPAPPLSFFPNPVTDDWGQGSAAMWDVSTNDSVGGALDDASMPDAWSSHRATSNATTDASMPDIVPSSSSSSKLRTAWSNTAPRESAMGNNEKSLEQPGRQMVMTMRDDRFGAFLEALSPPKKKRSRENSSQRHAHEHQRSNKTTPQADTSKMSARGARQNTKPSAAALARKASYPELRSTMHPNGTSPPQIDGKKAYDTGKPTYLLSASGKENRVPTPFQHESRIPTPHPHSAGFHTNRFYPQYPKLSLGSSQVDMRDSSSRFPTVSRLERSQGPSLRQSSPAPLPHEAGNVKSRKEGLAFASPGIRYNKSLLPPIDATFDQHTKAPQNTPIAAFSATGIEDLINTEEPRPFSPGHRSGMDSLDKIERQLFSALGDGSSFDGNAASVELDGGGILPELDLDSPVMKRKRQGTTGGERGRSPEAKMVKEDTGVSGLQGGVGNTV